jgi:hypothetical protein
MLGSTSRRLDVMTIEPATVDLAVLATAAERLSTWGFLAHPDLPDGPGPASLIVALRDVPTLRHYDPEIVEFWSTDGERGARVAITRATRMPVAADVSWGEIRITDRLGVSNEYLTFGGHCEAGEIGSVGIVVITSSAPILRRGGHSQGWDEGADAIGAFFGRLLVTVDYIPGFEAALAAADPLARYAACIADALARDRRIREAGRPERPFAAIVRVEAARLRSDHPDAWEVGAGLLSNIGRT